jgi:hypothetical protein
MLPGSLRLDDLVTTLDFSVLYINISHRMAVKFRVAGQSIVMLIVQCNKTTGYSFSIILTLFENTINKGMLLL